MSSPAALKSSADELAEIGAVEGIFFFLQADVPGLALMAGRRHDHDDAAAALFFDHAPRDMLGAEEDAGLLDDEILALDVPEFPQASSEAIEVGSIDCHRRSVEHADAIELLWRLRVDGQRRGD